MLPLLLKPELLMTLHDPEANFEFDPLVDPSADEGLPFLSHTPPEPRAVLARVLTHLTDAFVGDDGGPLDRALTTVALLLTKWLMCPFALRFVLAGGTGTGKSRLLHSITAITRVPATIVPVTQLAESTWQGMQLGDAVRALFPDEFTRRGANGKIIAPPNVIRRPCCLLLDEADKLSTVVGVDHQPLDGVARAWRIGRQQTLLTALDPLSEVLTRFEDVDGVVRWGLGSSIVVVAGAFPQFAPTEVITAVALERIGYISEFCDTVGVVLQLPPVNAAARRQIATVAADDMLRFARQLDIEVRGVDALVASLPAPGEPSASYLGVRGLKHHVEHRLVQAIAGAIARSESVANVDRTERRP